MTPTITFSNFQQLYDYIYQFIITNHNNEIIAIQHNNIESGLLDFVVQSPRNSFKGTVRNTAGNYAPTANECVLVFNSGGTGSITLQDNRWNEWVVINHSGATKQLVGSIANYVGADGIVRNYIPNSTSVSIAKGVNGVWYESASQGGGSGSALRFGIEDNTGIQDRQNALGDFILSVIGGTPDYSGVTGELYVSKSSVYLQTQDIDLNNATFFANGGSASMAASSGDVTSNITMFGNSVTVNQQDDSVTTNTLTFPRPVNISGNYYIPLSVNGNFADNAGNITISGSGRFGIEDNTGIQNRLVDMQAFNFEIDNISDLIFNAGDLTFTGAASNFELRDNKAALYTQSDQNNYSIITAYSGSTPATVDLYATVDNGSTFSEITLNGNGLISFSGTLQATSYGLGTNTGTPTFFAAFDSSGNIIEANPAFSPDTSFQWSVLSIQNSPPGGAGAGDTYLVGTSPTGAFAGHANEIADTADGINYTFQTASVGDFLYNAFNDLVYQLQGSTWVIVGKRAIHQGLDNLANAMKIGTLSNQNFGFWTNNTQRLTISNAGAFTFIPLTGAAAGLMGLSTTGVASNIQVSDANGFDFTLTGSALSLTTTVSDDQVFVSNNGAVSGSSSFTFDGTNFILTSGTLTSGVSGFTYSATMPSSISATNQAVNFQITGAGSSSQITRAFNVDYNSGYTGSSGNVAARFQNSNAGTGANLYSGGCNRGFTGGANGSTAVGYNIGAYGTALGGKINVGVVGVSGQNSATQTSVGGMFFGSNITGGGTQIGAVIGLNSSDPSNLVNSVLILDIGGSSGTPPFMICEDGSVVRATLDNACKLFLGASTTPTAWLGVAACTSATPSLHLTAGSPPSSPASGDLWYEVTNSKLMFRQNATSVEFVTTSAVNSVSPTSPNRTITTVINGTTYYIAAKTTND